MRFAARKNKWFGGAAAAGAHSTAGWRAGATRRANQAASKDDCAGRLRMPRGPINSQPVSIRPSQFACVEAPAGGRSGRRGFAGRDGFPAAARTGCFVACRPTPDNWRVPRPCLNWSSNVPSGTQTARGGRGPWQGRVGCDGTSRNCRQTAAVPICLRRDSGLLPRPRREECRSAQPSRQAQANPAAAFAAP